MNSNNNVLVLLSTYNGEKYLSELLDSVLTQKNVNVNILIRDDGSSDNTKKIIEDYQKRNKNIESYFKQNVGYARSFWDLLNKNKKYDYYAFCDQDDVWLEDKLYNAMELLKKEDRNIPLLYTSNVIPVDENLVNIKYNSFKENRVLNIYESFQKSILPGCTFVFNYKAKEIASKYDGYMESHDWTLYCIVRVFGKIIFDSNSRILYRISSQNTIGQDTKIKSLSKKIKRFFRKSKCTRSRFAKDFLKAYDNIPNVQDDIEQIAMYKSSIRKKIKFFFNKNFNGFIFKIYILLNKI